MFLALPGYGLAWLAATTSSMSYNLQDTNTTAVYAPLGDP
jgi:hypothetical protein